MTHISVIGCGYLGAVHAAAMASVGHTVVGIDTDKQKLQKLENYQPPFFEPGLAELLEAGQADHSAGQESADGTAQRLLFTSDISRAAEATVHFICVGTPQSKDSNAADMTYVNSAIADLMPHLKPGDLVVGKSTVPVGSAAELAKKIAPTGAKLAWNPEFLREGHAVEDTLRPDRIIYGVESGSEDDPAVAILDEVYAHNLRGAGSAGAGSAGAGETAGAVGEAGETGEVTPRLIMDYQTAELVKTAANSFLATKISFINAMAELCETAGGDVAVLADAIGMDKRIGRRFLNAGLGFGGGCLPKDIRAFIARADELGVEQAVSFLREVDSINLRRRARMVDLTREALGGDLSGKRITVLGIAFKPNTDDVRDSPALDVAERLEQAGAKVVITDPEAIENARLRDPELTYTPDLTEALTGADGVVLLTEWQQYKDLDPVAAGELVAQKIIVDGRNVVDRKAYREAGWTVRGLGRQE
ncbi:UDP-glucose 6-dehydrogenase [Brevibacterium ravenspurgense]|uniref:UDP-glucose 6-dehydrogenase n=1 Tax=Brevibacterium ravenspurgense TaxID=479117 RepID=A0A2I1IFM6_9MICO|nr:UDP-glucose/GDP-mannose dehydrogenase family protein [Brevibacterium ravenspurgense]PKY69928.1 UDP-glucose 6-dehydrogenase [Brevibacterium ravenspurgense]